MKKLLVLFFMIAFSLSANAKNIKNNLSSIITESGISKDSISVSIKNTETGKPIYELNEKILMHPASVQKILTLPPAMEILGEDYEFKTGIYSRNKGNYLIKLGADPYFDYSDLKSLAREVEKGAANIYIDDSIIEMKDWGEGWQWDDDLNTSMPRFNSYNLDKNLIKITVMPEKDTIKIINPSCYPITFETDITIGDCDTLKVSREVSNSTNKLTITGTISKPNTIYIPINNLERYFNIRLTQALANRNIYLKSDYIKSKKLPSDKLLAEITHPISDAEDDILKNSNNLVIETVAKLAASKASNQTGTDEAAIQLFNTYFKKLGLDNTRIKLVDSSGVSKNNLVDTDFITEYLIKSKDNVTLSKMAKPSEGTLSTRMIPLKENLRAKTGTLSDISSIAGYITSRKGEKYAFCIIINDPKSTNSEKKSLEDYLIREVYLKH